MALEAVRGDDLERVEDLGLPTAAQVRQRARPRDALARGHVELFRVRAEHGRTAQQIILSVVGTGAVRASLPAFHDL